jgi:hypothetical protein
MYPGLVELRTLEKNTLRCIAQMGEFGIHRELQAAANAAAPLINDDRGPVDVHLGFTLDIRFKRERKSQIFPRRIDVGALIAVTDDHKSIRRASYSLVICRRTNPATSPDLRKLHFDYEPIEFRNQAEPKPSVHMQLCGGLSPQQTALGYTEKRLNGLYPKFEKPRIPSAPTSIALMLNWLFLEFPTDSVAQAVLKNPRWRKLVAGAERTVLITYYEQASKFLGHTADREKSFLKTHMYEMVVD